MISLKARGSPRDIPYILVLVVTIAMSAVVVYGGTHEAHQQFQDLNETEDSLDLDRSTEFMGNVLGVFNLIDAGTIILIGVFFLGSVYSAFQVNSSKLFIVPSFLFLLTSLYLAGLMSDVYFMVAETGSLTSWFNFFDLQAKTFDLLGQITAVLGTVLFIATYINASGLQKQVGL